MLNKQTTTTKVSPEVCVNVCVVDSVKTSGRLGVKQLSERFNALSEGRGDAVNHRPGQLRHVSVGDDEMRLKKTSDKSDMLCPGREERRRASVNDVQTLQHSRTFQGKISGRGFPCGGQRSILTDDSTKPGPGTNFGELGQETRRR